MIPYFQFNTINLGPITIQVWGFFVALGLIVSCFIILRRSKFLGYNAETMLDIILWMVVSGFIFSRVFHVIFYEPSFFFANPIQIIKIWQGGLSSFGGFFGAALGFWAYIKKHKISKKKIWSYLDVITFGAIYGWIVGRIGCFSIHDHLGIPYDSFLSINTPGGPRMEMSLLEIVGLIPLAFLFFFQKRKEKPPGWYLSTLFIYYGFLRFILDFFRATDIAAADVRYLRLTPAQYFSIIFVALGIFAIRKIREKGV